MNSDQYRKALARLSLTQAGASRLFDVNERTSRYWASGKWPVPRAVEIVLWFMIKYKIGPEDIPD